MLIKCHEYISLFTIIISRNLSTGAKTPRVSRLALGIFFAEPFGSHPKKKKPYYFCIRSPNNYPVRYIHYIVIIG